MSNKKEKCDYVTTVEGQIIVDALAHQLDDIEYRIGDALKERNYYLIKMLAEQAASLEDFRTKVCVTSYMEIYDVGGICRSKDAEE